MKFHYKAKTKEGEDQVGFVDAANKDAAAALLGSHGLFILSVEAAGQRHWYDRFANVLNRVNKKELTIFTRQMATLFEARLPLTDVIKTLYDQTAHPALRDAIYEIRGDIDAGLAFSQALERQSHIFPKFFISMIRSAEVTGNLERVAGFLADYLEKELILVTKARSALVYPAIVVSLFIVVAFIMVAFVFPQIAPVFEQSGVALPFFTRLLIGVGNFISGWWLALVLLLIVVSVIVIDYLGTSEGKTLLDDMKVKFPIVRRVYLPLTVARFSNIAYMLLKSGVPVAQAMEIASQTIDNVLYEELLTEVSSDVRQGVYLADSFARFPDYFPSLVPQMIAIGEKTGQVDEIFARIAAFYGREADSVVNNLVELIQPALMIGIGVLVGLLFASVLLPLYQLTGTIQ